MQETAEPTTETQEPTDTIELLPTQMPMFSVSLPTQTQSVTLDNGIVLMNNTFQDISLIIPDPDAGNKIILDFLNRTDTTQLAEQVASQAKADYETNCENWIPYLSQITYDPMRFDSVILSMFGSYVSYNGAAHSGATYRSVTYDLSTGNTLSLKDILVREVNSETIFDLVIESLEAQAADKLLYTGYEGTVNERFQKNISNDNDWYLSSDGLCFYFSPYEIAPYSSGAIIATITYRDLTGILNDAYFPSERTAVNGIINAEQFSENSMTNYSQIAEIILSDADEKSLLQTDGAVYDVRIVAGDWSADGAAFIPMYTVFASYRLTPGDAIVIGSKLSETLPHLSLSYVTQDKTINKFISWDSQTGQPILTD